MYAWSMRSLARRLEYFDIKFINHDVSVAQVRQAVEKEMNGPGVLLGYRALHKKIREVHGLNVPRSLVYAVMIDVNPQGLTDRGGVGKPKRPKRTRVFTSAGPNSTMSLDGHDKLCGFQKAMFPLCIYGGQDTYSARINFLRIWTTNNDPKVVGRFYFDYLYESKVLPLKIRIDKGTETGVMATMHSFIRADYGDLADPTECVLYGPSTQNKIERWWRDLLERLEKFFKKQLSALVEDGQYDPTNELDRNLLAYVYIPVIQKELDIFRISIWNSHRVRRQKNKELPTGVPEHIYCCPEQHGGEECGLLIPEDLLQEVVEVSDILNGTDDYLEAAFRQECERHIPNTDDIEPAEADSAFLYLKDNFDENRL